MLPTSRLTLVLAVKFPILRLANAGQGCRPEVAAASIPRLVGDPRKDVGLDGFVEDAPTTPTCGWCAVRLVSVHRPPDRRPTRLPWPAPAQ